MIETSIIRNDLMCRIGLINDLILLAGIHDTEDNRIFQMIQRVELVNQMMGIMREEEPFHDEDISYDKSKEICCVLFLPAERRNRKMKNGRPFRNV